FIAEQTGVRSSGDQSSRDSIDNIFRDVVLIDVPVIAMGPSGQPVIDMNNLLVNNASTFYGGAARGLNVRLAEVSRAKAFPENVEIAFDVPDRTGEIKTFHYSMSLIQGTPGYKPRKADSRVGYFVTSYRDLGKVDRDDVYQRYINRWHIEKADKSLKLSPPKEPVVYYVEHTVPVRYRRWVREGIEYWNEAFREIGIDGAIEVRYQDKATGAHMEKDPEDVRFNFIRWLNNDISTAIGPSRVNPMTGEILDADVILTDGWLRVFTFRWNDLLPDLAMEGFSPETLEWLEERPQWDPRVRLASPSQRDEILAERQRQRGVQRFGGIAKSVVGPALADTADMGLPGLDYGAADSMCHAATGKAMQLATAQMHLAVIGELADFIFADEKFGPDDVPPEMIERLKKQVEENPAMLEMLPPEMRAMLESVMDDAGDDDASEGDDAGGDDAGKPKSGGKPEWASDMIDGMPEEFVGPMLAELVAHEVGHTIGLRHNFKGSSAYTLEEINSPEFKGNRAWSTTVMDYNGINIRMPMDDGTSGEIQGDFSSSAALGPYDQWVIEYGYGFGDTSDVLARVADPELQYATDEDTWGPDPYARRYDLGKDTINWARNQIELVAYLRETLVEKFVKDGETWAKARQGFNVALSEHVKAVSAMANWVGGVHVYRDKKGDPEGRQPIDPVSADKQREALTFVIDHTFYDEAFGLTPEILRHLSVEKWWEGGVGGSIVDDNNLPVHDRILGIQSAAMTMVINPTTLRRVHDNQYFFEDESEALTLAEVMRSVTGAAWEELLGSSSRSGLEISSLRQNLQREHVDRLIDLVMPGAVSGAASKPVAAISAMHLREIKGAIDEKMDRPRGIDDGVKAHLMEVASRIDQALDAQYIFNTDDISSDGGPFTIMFGQDSVD
ncbi:MAG: zinc-dependent metalloprotease, partial [Planctomycetota bacterium]